jgi:hypothetical protein
MFLYFRSHASGERAQRLPALVASLTNRAILVLRYSFYGPVTRARRPCCRYLSSRTGSLIVTCQSGEKLMSHHSQIGRRRFFGVVSHVCGAHLGKWIKSLVFDDTMAEIFPSLPVFTYRLLTVSLPKFPPVWQCTDDTLCD